MKPLAVRKATIAAGVGPAVLAVVACLWFTRVWRYGYSVALTAGAAVVALCLGMLAEVMVRWVIERLAEQREAEREARWRSQYGVGHVVPYDWPEQLRDPEILWRKVTGEWREWKL